MDNIPKLKLYLQSGKSNAETMLRIKDGFKGERAILLPKMVVEMLETDPLTRGLYITDIGFYPMAKHHFRSRQTPSGQYILIYCMDGGGWYKLDGRSYKVNSGEFFILPPDRGHSYGADTGSPWTIYWIHFNGPMAGEYARDLHTPHTITTADNSRIHDRLNLFEEIFYTLKQGYSLENIRYATALFHHFLGSLRFLRQYRAAKTATTPDEPTACRRAMRYMEENLHRTLTLREIAEFVGYRPSHFSALFKAESGHSPLSFFNLMKVQTACRLLDSTDMHINQIAAKLGVADPYYFSRLFTKIMGLPPTSYRATPRD